MKSHSKYPERVGETPSNESLIFANRSLDSHVESTRFSHLLAPTLYTAQPPPLKNSSVCSASLWIAGVCSAASGFEEPEFCILNISQERGEIQLRRRCDLTSAPAYVELMPFQDNTFFLCHRYAEPKSLVHGQSAPAEQGYHRDLGPLPIPGSTGPTWLAFHRLM